MYLRLNGDTYLSPIVVYPISLKRPILSMSVFPTSPGMVASCVGNLKKVLRAVFLISKSYFALKNNMGKV